MEERLKKEASKNGRAHRKCKKKGKSKFMTEEAKRVLRSVFTRKQRWPLSWNGKAVDMALQKENMKKGAGSTRR